MTRKTVFFKVWSRFKFNNLGLALGTKWKFYTSVVKRLKLKVRKFLGVIPTFVKIKGEKLVRGGGGGLSAPPPILNRVNIETTYIQKERSTKYFTIFFTAFWFFTKFYSFNWSNKILFRINILTSFLYIGYYLIIFIGRFFPDCLNVFACMHARTLYKKDWLLLMFLLMFLL